MVDSGSVKTFINENTAKKLKLFTIPKNKTIALAASDQHAKITGEAVVDLILKDKTHSGITIEIIENLFIDLIIGKDILKKYKKVTLKFDGPRDKLIIGAINTNNFFPTINVPPPPLFSNLSPHTTPIATKSRRYTFAANKFIKEETARMLKEGIIEPSISPWRAQVLVTSNENHKKRMVVDYSDTINRFTELDAYPMPNINKMVDDIAQYNIFSTLDLKSAYHQIPINHADRKFTAFEVSGKLFQFTRLPFGVTNGVSAFQRSIDYIIEKENLTDTFVYVDNVTICGKNQEEHDYNLQKFYKIAKQYNITLNENKSIISSSSITLLGYTIENNQIAPDYQRLKPLLEMPPPLNLKSQKRIVGMFSYYCKFIKKFSDKILLLNQNKEFPLPPSVLKSFQTLKNDLKDATLITVDPNKEFEVETDASNYCIAATLNQEGRPIAFFSRTLNTNEIKHHAVEKEAAAIVEALRKWRHFLLGRHFKVITDQKSISFIFDNKRKSKIKNDKICRWRIELSQYNFTIVYRPGPENIAADTFSRISALTYNLQDLRDLHKQLCHPGVSRLSHFIRTRNLPFTLDQIKNITDSCSSCQLLKPKFANTNGGTLIQAILPFQRLNLDFKGPLPTSIHGNKYLLTLIDEYSRFPFAFPCRDMTSKTIIHCLNKLFSIFGLPDMIHTDRASDFLAREIKDFLHKKGIATSKTSRYHPEGNGQIEKLNGTLWKAIQTTLHSNQMKLPYWEDILPDALHSIRSLLCTATNMTPHDRLFKYSRKSASGISIPSWVKPGPIYIRNHTKTSKHDPPVTPATLIDVNPHYAYVQLPSGTETTVNVRDLAPNSSNEENSNNNPTTSETLFEPSTNENIGHEEDKNQSSDLEENQISLKNNTENQYSCQSVRRSPRVRQFPSKYKDFVTKY